MENDKHRELPPWHREGQARSRNQTSSCSQAVSVLVAVVAVVAVVALELAQVVVVAGVLAPPPRLCLPAFWHWLPGPSR